MKKVPAKVQEIRNYKLKQESGAKNISFSQLSMYLNCPRCWQKTYIDKEAPYQASIHTVFGTAVHETLQKYLDVLYNETAAAADKLDLEALLESNLRACYLSSRESMKKDFTTPEELSEFYEDGVAIVNYVKKHRRALFPSNRTTWLVGCEVPIYTKLQEKFYFKGFIDVLTYDEGRNIWKIWDIKTSTRGWKDEKADFIKTSQVILYKEFLHQQFGIPLDEIEVEYFIVKRKIIEDAEFAAMRKRVQEFVPRVGPRIHKKVLSLLEVFVQDTLSESGEYQEKEYAANPSDKNCRWCVFKETCKK